MKFREWVEKYAPEKVDSTMLGGVRGCPMDSMPCGDVGDSTCAACWDREMPGTIRVRKARTVRTILFDQEEIIENCTIVVWKNSKTGETSFGWIRGGKRHD